MTTIFVSASAAGGPFDIQFNVNYSGFNSSQRVVLDESLAYAEAMWEGIITSYPVGVTIPQVIIDVREGSALASANPTDFSDQGGFRFTTRGFVNINNAAIDLYAAWDGTGPPDPNSVDPNFIGLNYVDDILAHEIGHVLGIGPLWAHHRLRRVRRIDGVFKYVYTGQHGLAAFRQEFDPNADFVPIENEGSGGTIGVHWDQLMRSSSQEGDPDDPWSLDPRLGIVDAQGRDFSLELMTGALDPDYGEPFLSFTSIQSLRDLGYVVPEPSSLALAFLTGVTYCSLRRRRVRRILRKVGRAQSSSDRIGR